ncbi:MAG: SDR family NAD(P)-dependent oxidoreductase [Gammaproteobacteria bacterium]|nr:SDR family NAD(P)-dependent oxidoreductase [Gammaproteobacteria bacterium]
MTSETTKKSVLITGCSSGIGLCVAQGLQARGYRVFATARKQADVEALEKQGLESLPLDLADSTSIQDALEEVLKRTGGRLDALFNNGAYGQPGAVEDLTRDVLRAQLETNLLGTVELTNRVIPVMREQGGGRIIQNSSVLGFIVLPYRGAYSASKYALEALSDAMRQELRGSGVSVSLIQPGPITSAFRQNAFAKYQENIDKSASYHRATYEGMERRLTKQGPAQPFTLPPEAVLKKVIHALESRRPRARYAVTFPTYLFAWLKRLLSTRGLDWVLNQVSSKENQ